MTARIDGYAPIADYGAIGDGRTVALVARDGAVDWLCLPDLDSASVFGALVDTERGGRFLLEPESPYETERRYRPGTNVLETTFTTASGAVRVTDALTLPGHGLGPYRELVRSVDGLTGHVPLRWRVEPRFSYAAAKANISTRAGVPVATAGRDAIAVCPFDAGEPKTSAGSISGRFTAREGSSSLLVLSVAHQEPLVLPHRDAVLARLEATARAWAAWSDDRSYDGPWREAVVRSALALKLLVYVPSGAIAAAATTSLPEEIGTDRNWDYRYSWPRDSAFTLEALITLGCAGEAQAFFWWLLHASQLTHPRFRILYRLDGRSEVDERSLPLAGYRGSRPVRVGNGAAGQTQLDVYGEVLAAAATFASFSGALDRDHARRLAEIAEYVCDNWEQPDAGIWELRGEPRHFTQSKMMCSVALARACELPANGLIPAKGALRWRREETRIREFVERHCYSDAKASYVRSAGDDELDAALLLAVRAGYEQPGTPRLSRTVDAVRRELGDGPLIHRWPGEPGAFLACSFWLADAYARLGVLDEAAALMDALVGLANDLGLYAEEMQPATRDFLGNFPQALTHVALINAAGGVLPSTGGGAVIWGALVGGLAGTVVLTTILRAASELGLGRARVLRRLPGRRSKRLPPRRGLRPVPRAFRRQRPRQHPAAGRASAHGHRIRRRRLLAVARASRLHAPQLRTPHRAGVGAGARRVRRDRRRACVAGRLKDALNRPAGVTPASPAEARTRTSSPPPARSRSRARRRDDG